MVATIALYTTIVLLLAAVFLTNLAERLAVPYPSLLAIAGAGLAFLPFAPQIRIEPELALALFVAPALLDAAFDTSPRGLRDNAMPIASMAVVAVVLTTVAIAFLGWRFAGLPIAAAIALGAIVAPPDAVAANEVLRHLRIPQRIGLVLQGESMLDDATALLIYRAAVLAAAGSFSLAADAPILVLAAAGGLIAGYVLARLYLVASSFVRDPASNTVLQFVSTFGVWLLSERLGFSPIITVVIYAMKLAQAAPGRLGARLRISSYQRWGSLVVRAERACRRDRGSRLAPPVSGRSNDRWQHRQRDPDFPVDGASLFALTASHLVPPCV
jgi:monovalent cation/hydrogen antiporter